MRFAVFALIATAAAMRLHQDGTDRAPREDSKEDRAPKEDNKEHDHSDHSDDEERVRPTGAELVAECDQDDDAVLSLTEA